MSEIYSIAVVCVPSDRLITDENGEQFYEWYDTRRVRKNHTRKRYTLSTLFS